MILAIPTPPTVNGAWFNVRGKGRVRSKEYRAWIAEAGWALKVQRTPHIGGKVTVEIGIGRIPNADVDNRIKPVLDLLVKMSVIDDDRHVEKVSAEWRDDITGAVVTVRKHEKICKDGHSIGNS